MAVGDFPLPALLPVPGLKLAAVEAGVKYPNRKDLVVMALPESAATAGVFTKNAFCAAPVQVAKAHLAECQSRYLIINTGNANAGTGERGMANARSMCEAVAKAAGCETAAVLPFSTGVIGEPLPIDTITAAVPKALAGLEDTAWADAAEGIMTTDTRPKGNSQRLRLGDTEVVLTGISKGAGMIKPNMATMLSYIATDAKVSPAALQAMLDDATEASFNRITVDGDTSTNDACILMATGVAGNDEISGPEHPDYGLMAAAVKSLMIELAQLIVRDGEGATKFVSIEVAGGKDSAECVQVAYTVAESPLVKTALFASDPNWGRILAAVGRAGLSDLDVNAVSLYLNDVLLAENGGVAASYTEAVGEAAMAPEDIVIRIELGRGVAEETVWTTDLSHDYVRINAEYRT